MIKQIYDVFVTAKLEICAESKTEALFKAKHYCKELDLANCDFEVI
jgi:hypothetical protein